MSGASWESTTPRTGWLNHFIEAANETSLDPKEVLEWLRFSVAGIDVHPVAVHLARAAWVLAAVEDGFAIRIAREAAIGVTLDGDLKELPLGRGSVIREGRDVVIFGLGRSASAAVGAAERLAEYGIAAAL